MSYIIPGDQCKYILRKCPKPLIKNTFAGALAQESSHYVTLGNSTITFFICQQFFPSFSIFFSIDTAALFSCLYHRCFALIMKEKSCSRITYPQKETEELHLSNITKHALEESLKRLLLKKPLTKITINGLKNLQKSFLPGAVCLFTLESPCGFFEAGPFDQIIDVLKMIIKLLL